MILYYIFIKAIFFFSLVRTLVKFDPMKDHVLFLGILYTAGVAFLYYVFFMSWQDTPNWRAYEIWLGKTLVLATVYFWLLKKFDEGVIFWTLLLLGMLVVYY